MSPRTLNIRCGEKGLVIYSNAWQEKASGIKSGAGSQEHEDAPAVHAPDFLCGGNAVHAVHVNVHKNGIKTAACRKAAVPECLKEAFRIQEWDSFHMAVTLCAKVADKPLPFRPDSSVHHLLKQSSNWFHLKSIKIKYNHTTKKTFFKPVKTRFLKSA